jgi:hypothetical protein
MFDHRPAVEIGQRLAWETCRLESSRDEDDDFEGRD